MLMMKKTLCWLLPVVLLSCEKTVYSPDPADDTYSLKQITYQVAEGDRMETFARPLHSLTYNNQTSVAQQVIVDPLAAVTESSLFISDDENAFALLGGAAPAVAVPLAINGGTVEKVGEAKWPYRGEAAELAPSLNFRDTITVPPHTRLTLLMNVYFNEIELSYTATFEGQPTGTIVEAKGKWRGVAVANVEKQLEFHPAAATANLPLPPPRVSAAGSGE